MNRKALTYFLTVILVLVAASNAAWGQRKRSFKFENLPYHDQKPYHFGFSLGFNKMDFALEPINNLHNVEFNGTPRMAEFDTLNSVLTRAENGFHIGIVSNLNLGSQWDLRFIPTLSFGDRNIVYSGL